jgi:hypothetical protein
MMKQCDEVLTLHRFNFVAIASSNQFEAGVKCFFVSSLPEFASIALTFQEKMLKQVSDEAMMNVGNFNNFSNSEAMRNLSDSELIRYRIPNSSDSPVHRIY